MEVMIRLGEMTLKSRRSRKRFMNRLIRNIRDALIHEDVGEFKIRNMWSRILVKMPDVDDIPGSLARVFGIVSFSPVHSFKFDSLSDILERGEEFFKDHVRGKKFAVRARRVGSHSFSSMDVARELGSRLYNYSDGVDLTDPEVEAFVEIRDDTCFFYKDVFSGYGGLPIGTEGRVVSLLSGGFDSAVASWFLLKRGAEVHYLFLNLDGDEYLQNVLKVAKVLGDNWSYGYEPIIHVVPGKEIVIELMGTREDYWNVLLKRVLYRLGEMLADDIKADSLVTGESLGQVSSQTLKNLRVSQEAVSIPVNRPLFGMDKEEIIRIAREIGTYKFSEKVWEYCALVPEKPVLSASREVVEREESKIDKDVIYKAFREKLEISLRKLDIELSL
jgi:thiamine biosynthesis protein ThiI